MLSRLTGIRLELWISEANKDTVRMIKKLITKSLFIPPPFVFILGGPKTAQII